MKMKMTGLPLTVHLPLAVCMAVGLAVTLGVPTARAADVADVKAGEARYLENCVNCHGKTGKGMASFPSIQGRDADYIAKRLTQYRNREQVGPNSAIMMSLSADLSDADIANLAAYISKTFDTQQTP